MVMQTNRVASHAGSKAARRQKAAVRELGGYAATATAAAIGGAGIADAAIISSTGLNLALNASTTPLNLDFTGPGGTVATFQFKWSENFNYEGQALLSIFPNAVGTEGTKSVVASTATNTRSLALAADTEIGSATSTWSTRTLSTNAFSLSGMDSNGNANGNFNNTSDKYIGVRFTSGADTYYGWIQYSANAYTSSPNTGTITGWAYNDVAGESILAGQVIVPEPTGLAMLAAGALAGTASIAVQRWRSKQPAV
jgi:hypothetical protein